MRDEDVSGEGVAGLARRILALALDRPRVRGVAIFQRDAATLRPLARFEVDDRDLERALENMGAAAEPVEGHRQCDDLLILTPSGRARTTGDPTSILLCIWLDAPEPLTADEARLLESIGELAVEVHGQTQHALREKSRVPGAHRQRSGATIVGASRAMERVWRLIERVQDSDVTVLVQGETGTGKELIARAIHEGGARARQPLVTVDCGALPVSLAESEFFGYRKGAFTDAHRDRAGLIEQASGGSIFIDEIGDITMELQAKLLRFLQEGTVRRIGDTRPVTVDVRVIAATNRDLRARVEEGSFRRDLYYRLAVVPISVPPLRERREDIPLLVQHFSDRIARESGREALAFTDAALAAFVDHDWPGNVRECENMLRRLAALSSGALIGVEDLPASVRGALSGEAGNLRDAETAAAERVARRMLEAALEASSGDVRDAARALATPVKTVYYKLKRLGIDPGRYRRRD